MCAPPTNQNQTNNIFMFVEWKKKWKIPFSCAFLVVYFLYIFSSVNLFPPCSLVLSFHISWLSGIKKETEKIYPSKKNSFVVTVTLFDNSIVHWVKREEKKYSEVQAWFHPKKICWLQRVEWDTYTRRKVLALLVWVCLCGFVSKCTTERIFFCVVCDEHTSKHKVEVKEKQAIFCNNFCSECKLNFNPQRNISFSQPVTLHLSCVSSRPFLMMRFVLLKWRRIVTAKKGKNPDEKNNVLTSALTFFLDKNT